LGGDEPGFAGELGHRVVGDAALDALVVRERARVVAPLTDWRVLSAQLRDEGLVRSGAGQETPEQSPVSYTDAPRPRSGFYTWGRRLMAGTALFGGGILIGRSMTFGAQVIPMIKTAIQNDSIASAAGPRTVLGAKLLTVRPELANALHLPATGVVVVEVTSGTSAEAAGLKVGDVIVSASGTLTPSPSVLSSMVKKIPSGPHPGGAAEGVPTLSLLVNRDGTFQTLTLHW